MTLPRPNIRLWLMPALLATLSVIGLFAALLDDGFGDLLSWLMLCILNVVILRHLIK